MMKPVTETRDAISLNLFSLDASRRLLVEDGIELGARTLDILIELACRPCDIVSTNDLPARVCPDVIVEEVSLRFHIVDLRKAFGYARDDARDIATLRARGYCFVAAIGSRRLPRRFAFRTPIFRALIGMFGREYADDAYE